jgi:hypothetical protein
VHVDENEFTVKILGVNETTNELVELYKVTVHSDDKVKNFNNDEFSQII